MGSQHHRRFRALCEARTFAAALVLLGSGCLQGTQINTGGSTASASSGAATSSAGSSGGLAAASSTGATGATIAAGTSSTGGSGSGGSSSGGAISSTGSNTGASTTGAPALPPVDGGYVYCSLETADAGAVVWLCRPGTYFCLGELKSCSQCRSDQDCADRDLPTYDPRRPRCDVSSGVLGYQGFCQECTSDADCASDPTAPFCDLNASLGLTPTIATLGFESCARTDTDCRKDGGPPCGLNSFCDPVTGACKMRSLTCTNDADCAGLFADTNRPMAYCFDGMCTACAGGACTGYCNSSADCGNPGGLPDGGMFCSDGLCQCQNSSACQGATPVCEYLDAFASICGCDDDQECGDAGLHCFWSGTGGSFCGVPCSSPEAPACPTGKPVCEVDSGVCVSCLDDADCRTAPAGRTCDSYGICACGSDADCPSGEACRAGTFYGSCGIALAGCDPAICLGQFCDWDSGACIGSTASFDFRCITDYDCVSSSGYDRCAAGSCVQCLDDNDCAVIGLRIPGESFGTYCNHGICTNGCRNDGDCIGNPEGPSCELFGDAGSGVCQNDYCHSNADCAANFYGHRCDLDAGGGGNEPGTCDCLHDSDCPADRVCLFPVGGTPFCMPPGCQTDSDCPNEQRCFPQGGCRDACGDGGGCGAATPACDTGNAAGLNGKTYQGPDPSVVWCYQCLASTDCLQGQGCYMLPKSGYYGFCGACFDSTQCSSGPCVNGTCLSPCDGGSCGPGMVCDTGNAAGNGADLCYQCLSPIDCPSGEGCNGRTHLCGSCTGPSASGGSDDCPPGSVCSNYWVRGSSPGVCLQQCDAQSCPADRPDCAVFPPLSQEQAFCFGCLSDADCADGPPGTWCDTSINLTFTCQPPVAP